MRNDTDNLRVLAACFAEIIGGGENRLVRVVEKWP